MGGRKLWIWMAAAVIAFFLIGNYGLRNLVILPSFSELEKVEAQKDVARVVGAIAREAHHIGLVSSDWAVFDDTYRFVQDGNSEYIDSNLRWETLEPDTGLNLIYICDLEGRVVWGEIHDSARGGRLVSKDFPADALGANHTLLQFESLESDHTGLILTDLGPMLLSAHPILTSTGEGPMAGTFLMGRFLNEKIVEELRKQTKVDFALTALGGKNLSEDQRQALERLGDELSVVEEAGTETLLGYGRVADLRGGPGLLISVYIPRNIMEKGLAASRFTSFSVLLGAIAVVVIGTVIVIMIFNLMKGGESRSGLGGVDLLTIALVASAGLGVTFAAFSLVRDWEGEKLEARFQELAQERIGPFRQELEHNIDEIDALRRLYRSSGEVGRREFRAFVTPSLEKHQAIKALEWVPRVKAEDRSAHENAARGDGLRGYTITERAHDGSLIAAAERETYYPVAYVEPLGGNEAALGYAPGPSNSERLAAIEKARDTGEITATGGVKLVQDEDDLLSILVFAPVYGAGGENGTLEDRRQNLKGLAMGVFRIGEVFEESTKGIAPDGIDVAIFDRSGAGEDLLYFHSSRLRGDGVKKTAARRLEHVEDLEVGGRKWSVVCTAAPGFFEGNRQRESLSVLVAGLLLTGWLTSYVIGSRRRTAGIEAVVRKRTADLQKSEARFRNIFESVEDVYSETRLSDGTFVELSPSVENLLGYKREELIGASFAALYASSSDRAAFLRRLKEEGYVSDYEVVLIGRSRKEVVCSFNARVVVDGAGEERIVGTMRDISARKRSEEALRKTMEEAEFARKRAEGSEESLRRNREQLLETLAEMERFNRLMMKREGRVLELKEEVNGLLLEAGRPAAYETAGGAS